MSEADVRASIDRAGSSGGRPSARFRGALLLPGDDLVLCLFDSSSRAAVKRASERAGMPCERVIETVWLGPPEPEGGLRCSD